MAATFPGGVKVFTTKQAGDQIASAHINDLQDEVVAVETELRKTSGSVVSHGSLAGLSNNDHPQYLLAATGKAADSDKLDGNDSAYFMPISYKDGWTPDSDTWSYVSTTSFKVSGKDVRYKFPRGTKIKLVQSGSTKYFYVVATNYSADTTITITGGSDYSLANEAISGQAYSYAAAPQGFSINATGGTWIYKTDPFSSSSFDGGGAFSSCDMTLIDLSSVFGIPDGVKAVDVRIVIRDSGSANKSDIGVCLSPTNLSLSGRACIISGLPNGYYAEQNMVVPCNSDGDIYYQVVASGTNTMNIYMVIFGYLL